MTKVFDPNASHTLSIAVASTSAELTGMSGTDNQVRIYNPLSATVFVRWGTSAQTAVTTDMAIAPGTVEMFTKNNATRLAAISTSTGSLYITTGTGE
jgi:predicted RNA-binding protein